MIDAIIEYMTTYHDNGRYGAYGWVYVLSIAVSIFSALAARELQTNRKRLLNETKSSALSRPLEAVAIVDQSGVLRQVEGKFYAMNGYYEFSLCETVNGTQTRFTHTFTTIEQLEKFLESNTVLRLGDFKSG